MPSLFKGKCHRKGAENAKSCGALLLALSPTCRGPFRLKKSFEKGGGRSSIAGMQVRPANRKDLREILEIYNEAVLNTTASYDYEPRTLEHRTQWYEERAKARYPIFVAEDGKGQVVAWSALNPFHSRIGYQFTAENSVYVAAEHRGKGIGKLLMPPLIEGAKARGLHAIIAAIDAQNEASIRLHAQFGFEKVALLKEVGFKFNRWLDVVYMERLV